jgi:tetratricopeptide (TPR) repeat protein
MRARRLVPPPPRKTRRRWRVPPALTHGPEALESAGILDEFPDALGVLFWQTIRDVNLWAAAPEEEREELFSPKAARLRAQQLRSTRHEPPLATPLATLAQLLDEPARFSADKVSFACEGVAVWAEERGQLATALEFAQGAAVASPRDAAFSLDVAKIARSRAEHARAETWFRRTIGLARQSGDWVSYAQAFLGLGVLYIRRGNFPQARRFLIRSLRAAKRHSLRDVQGSAYHDLFVVATETGRAEEAEHYARLAVQTYEKRNPYLPMLAHDVAYFWMTQGRFARALPVLRALEPHFRKPAMRLIVLSGIARAAGALRDRDAFEQAWEAARPLADTPETEDRAASSLMELARGAASIGEWKRAEEAAGQAVERARARRESHVLMASEAVLQAARSGRAAEEAVGGRDGSDPLAEELVRTLEEAEVAV